MAAQRLSLEHDNPEPAALWTLVGTPRMWERRPADADFCRVRVGIGNQPLAARLVVASNPPSHEPDPVTAEALRHFVHTYSTLADAPVAISLGAVLRIDGDVAEVRGLLRAIICQLAVLHAPGDVAIVSAISERNRIHWDWLKWLPHHQHVCSTLARARRFADGAGSRRVVVLADLDDRGEPVAITGLTVLQVGVGGDGMPVLIRGDAAASRVPRSDGRRRCAELPAGWPRTVSAGPAVMTGRPW